MGEKSLPLLAGGGAFILLEFSRDEKGGSEISLSGDQGAPGGHCDSRKSLQGWSKVVPQRPARIRRGALGIRVRRSPARLNYPIEEHCPWRFW